MNRLRQRVAAMLAEDRGNAMTEFVIVIPVVLLFFFSILQYYEVVKASQLANYAAFVAARTYAVRDSIEGDDQAKKTATKAAALAMAPVARLVYNEAGGLGPISQFLPGGFPSLFNNVARIGEGFLTAQIRLDESIGGGKVDITTSGNPKQVDVQINYPQPIYVPGLAEFWALVAGDKGIHHSLSSLRTNLTGLPASILPGIEAFEGVQQKLLQVSVCPYVDIHGKCSIGFSDWGSKDPEYRPRKPDTVTDVGSNPADVGKINQATDSATAAKQYNSDLKAAESACTDLCSAKKNLADAQANQVRVNNDPNSTPTDKTNAATAVGLAQGALTSAQGAYDTAHAKLETSRQAVETATGQSQQDFNCSC
jgi:Flp pilus assembly protein TadG